MMIENSIPSLNPVTRFLLSRYKNRLLDMPCTRGISALVGCVDFLLEADKEAAINE